MTKQATPKDNAAFGLWQPDIILPLFDVWVGSNYNTIAVFGVPYIELPTHIADDLRALMHRKAQLEAAKPKR